MHAVKRRLHSLWKDHPYEFPLFFPNAVSGGHEENQEAEWLYSCPLFRNGQSGYGFQNQDLSPVTLHIQDSLFRLHRSVLTAGLIFQGYGKYFFDFFFGQHYRNLELFLYLITGSGLRLRLATPYFVSDSRGAQMQGNGP